MPKEQASSQALPFPEARRVSDKGPVHAAFCPVDPRGAYPSHMHYELELGIVVSGRVRRFYGERQRDLEAGELWFCGMWEPHAYEVLQERYSRLVIWFWPPLLSNLFCPELPRMDWVAPFRLPLDQRPQTPEARREDVLALAERIRRILDAGDKGASALVRLVALELLVLLLAPCEFAANRSRRSTHAHGKITPALELAFRTNRMVTNEEAARVCGLTAR